MQACHPEFCQNWFPSHRTNLSKVWPRSFPIVVTLHKGDGAHLDLAGRCMGQRAVLAARLRVPLPRQIPLLQLGAAATAAMSGQSPRSEQGREADLREDAARQQGSQQSSGCLRSPAFSGPGVLLEASPSGPSHRGLLWHVLAKVPFRKDTFPLLTPSNTSHVTPGNISVYKRVFCFLFLSK